MVLIYISQLASDIKYLVRQLHSFSIFKVGLAICGFFIPLYILQLRVSKTTQLEFWMSMHWIYRFTLGENWHLYNVRLSFFFWLLHAEAWYGISVAIPGFDPSLRWWKGWVPTIRPPGNYWYLIILSKSMEWSSIYDWTERNFL